jgi:uncharacterized membrane protein YdjX (TVP38/TMEM64 family)
VEWTAIVPYILMALAIATAVVVLGREINHHIAAIESWVTGHGPWAPVLFVVLYVALTCVFVPDSILAAAAGALFGLLVGTLVVAAACLLAAALQYALAHRVLRAPVAKARERWPALAAIDRAVRGQDARFQFLIRLTPLNPTACNYLFGAAGVPFSGYLFAALGLLPAAFVEVYFGYAGKHIASLAGRGASPLHDAAVFVGLGLCVAALMLVSRVARRAIHDAGVVQSEPASPA